MKFTGGPLDGQTIDRAPDDLPDRLFVRHTGKGFVRGPGSFAYLFLAGDTSGIEVEFMASSADFDPNRLWIYEKAGDEYVNNDELNNFGPMFERALKAGYIIGVDPAVKEEP